MSHTGEPEPGIAVFDLKIKSDMQESGVLNIKLAAEMKVDGLKKPHSAGYVGRLMVRRRPLQLAPNLSCFSRIFRLFLAGTPERSTRLPRSSVSLSLCDQHHRDER